MDVHGPARDLGAIGDPNDETFHILEGELAFVVDGEIRRTGAGHCTFVPRDAAHTFRVLSPEVHFICVCTPAGHEALG